MLHILLQKVQSECTALVIPLELVFQLVTW